MNRPTGDLLHVVVRGRRSERIDGVIVDIVEAHNAVQKADGRVALAKFGQVPGASRMHAIRLALESGLPVELYLVFKSRGEFTGYSARLRETSLDRPTARSPVYYAGAGGSPGVWFVLSSPLKPASLSGLRLVSNNRLLVKVLAECRTAMMLVTN